MSHIETIEKYLDAVPAHADAAAPLAYIAAQVLGIDGERVQADLDHLMETARVHARPFLPTA